MFSRRFKTCGSFIFKKNDDLDEKNYRPVSILFNVPKVFERIIYCKNDGFMQDKLSNLLDRLYKEP